MCGDIVTSGQCCTVNGCQRVTITHVGGGDMDFGTRLLNDREVSFSAEVANPPLTVGMELRNVAIGASFLPKDGEGLSVAITLVCKPRTEDYLNVLPTELQWITVDMPVGYDVYSNTTWNVQ